MSNISMLQLLKGENELFLLCDEWVVKLPLIQDIVF